MEEKRLERRGMAMILLCTLMWSISGVLIKSVPWNPLAIAGGRSLIAGTVMALYMRATGVRFVLHRRAVLGALAMSGMFFCFTAANKLTTAANAIVIQSTAPVFILLYNGVFRRQRIRAHDALAVAVTLGGIAIFFFDELSPGHLLGNAVALVSGILLAAVYIVNGDGEQDARMSGILLSHMLTALVGLPLVFVTRAPLTAQALGGVVLMGVVQLGIPYVLFALAMRHCPPLAGSLIGLAEAVFNPLWVALATGEVPSPLALCGGVLVLVTLALWAIRSQRADVTPGAARETDEKARDSA